MRSRLDSLPQKVHSTAQHNAPRATFDRSAFGRLVEAGVEDVEVHDKTFKRTTSKGQGGKLGARAT